MEKHTSNITISKETKALLDLQRKRATIDDYLSSMLSYFTVTGINPCDKIVDRTDRILKRFDDVIKLIRAIEKNRIMEQGDQLTKICEHIFGTSVIERQEEKSATTDEVSIEELQKVVEMNQDLQQQLSETTRLLDKERKEKELYKSKADNTDLAYSTSLIKETIAKVQEISRPAPFDRNIYLIDRGDMHQVKSMLEELLNKQKS